MIEASYPYGEIFQRKLLALLVRDPIEVSGIVQPQFFTQPLLVDIARVSLEAYTRHPDARLTKSNLYELVRNSLGSRGDKYSRDYKKQIKKVFAVQLPDKPLLLEQAKDFAKETRYRNALVRGEHFINARDYEMVHKAIDEARLSAGEQTGHQTSAVDLPVYNLHQLLAADFETSQDYLVETIVPRGGSILSYGLPKGLKSWFSTGVALDAAIGHGKALGCFDVPRPVRVLLVQVEDSASRTKRRLQKLRDARLFRQNPYPGDLKIITRCPLNLADPHWLARLEAVIAKQKTELVIYDVLRRLFRGDVNSAQETAAFFELVDGLRDKYGVAVWIVHHSNKKSDGEMMTKAVGSINFTAWPDVLLYFKRKQESNGITTCNLEIETKDEVIEGELKVILDDEEEPMLRVEKAKPAEDKLRTAMSQLKEKWTIDELAGVLALKYGGAYKVLQDWLKDGIAALARQGSKGHPARYKFDQIAAK